MPNLLAQIKRDGHLLKKSVRPTKPKKGAIRKIKPSRASQMKEYFTKRAKYLKAHPWCQIWLKRTGWNEMDIMMDSSVWEDGLGDDGLGGRKIYVPRSSEIHHPRGRIGKLLTDETNFIACSRQEHLWLHAHPKEARALGLLR